MCEKQKPVYCLNITHLEISFYHLLLDKKFKGIVHLFSNIVHLDFTSSVGFTNKTLIWIAELYSNLKYLNLWKEGDDELITNKGLYAITNSYHKLEYLNIFDHKEISEIAI